MTGRPRYIIELVPINDRLGRDPIVRVRQLLKLALRGMGLRCVAIREAPAQPEAAPHSSPNTEVQP